MADSTEAISGRAIGVLFFASFGSLWLCTGLYSLHDLNAATGLGVAAIAAALIVPALKLLRRTSKAPATDAGEDPRIKRVFGRVNTIQWIAILASVVLLNVFGLGDYIIPAIATIVGLHLFPLAGLFRYPVHYVTGTLLVLWQAAVVLLLQRQSIASTGALGTAAILLLSATYTLANTLRAARALAL